MVSNELLIQRIMQERPGFKELVENSYPVTSFGDLTSARVLTIGINPSIDEFHSRKKGRPLLEASAKRLVDSEVLGIVAGTPLNREQAELVLKGNNLYFAKSGNPYHWFNALEEFALKPIGASYFDGSAAHVDLVQWATDPVWSRIQDEAVQSELVRSDVDFLTSVLQSKKWDLIILNGKEVYTRFREFRLFQLLEFEHIPAPDKKRIFWNGHSFGSPLVSWSANLPESRTSNETRDFVAKWVSKSYERVQQLDFKNWISNCLAN